MPQIDHVWLYNNNNTPFIISNITFEILCYPMYQHHFQINTIKHWQTTVLKPSISLFIYLSPCTVIFHYIYYSIAYKLPVSISFPLVTHILVNVMDCILPTKALIICSLIFIRYRFYNKGGFYSIFCRTLSGEYLFWDSYAFTFSW